MATELGGVSPATTDQDLDTGGAPDADERRRFARAVSRIRWRECAAPAAGTVFVTLIAAWYFQIRNGGLGTPITYREDALYYASITKSIIDHGWYLKDLSLGVPLGRFAYDYPLGSDNLNLAVIRGLTWLSSNPFVVNNVFLLLTFPAAFRLHGLCFAGSGSRSRWRGWQESYTRFSRITFGGPTHTSCSPPITSCHWVHYSSTSS